LKGSNSMNNGVIKSEFSASPKPGTLKHLMILNLTIEVNNEKSIGTHRYITFLGPSQDLCRRSIPITCEDNQFFSYS